jgi:hypothetical protein
MAHQAKRLGRAFDYAEDRAAVLDVREAVAAVLSYDNDETVDERADMIVDALRPVMVRTLTRRLEREPRTRERVATAMVAAVLP